MPALREAGIARGGKDFAETLGNMARLVVAQAQQERRQLPGLQADHGMTVFIEADIDRGRGDVDHLAFDGLFLVRQLPHQFLGQRIIVFFIDGAVIHFEGFEHVVIERIKQLVECGGERARRPGIHQHRSCLIVLLKGQLNLVALDGQ